VTHLSVRFGDTFEFVLLLDSIRVGRSLGGIDELIGQALGDGLDVTESGFTSTSAQKPDSLVDTSEGRDIDGLTSDSTSTSDTGRIFTGTRVDNGLKKNLDGVLSGGEVDDLESVLDDSDGHEFLAVVATVHHERVNETLNDGALSLTEPFDLVSARGVGQELGVSVLAGQIIGQGDVVDLNLMSE